MSSPPPKAAATLSIPVDRRKPQRKNTKALDTKALGCSGLLAQSFISQGILPQSLELAVGADKVLPVAGGTD